MLEEYRSRRDLVMDWLQVDSRIRVVKPAGAFYLFPDISELLLDCKIPTSAEFAQKLLTEAHVAVTPGEAFDAPGFLRISYATSIERLREGVARIHKFIRSFDPVHGSV